MRCAYMYMCVQHSWVDRQTNSRQTKPTPPLPPHSIFEDNQSLEPTADTSAIAAFRFPTVFKGYNYFIRNIGGGITLLNTRMEASGKLLFDSNRAVFGGGIAMDDRCLVSERERA